MIWMMMTAALASFDYPSEVQAETEAPCPPTCTLCHETNAGGSGTVVQPFGEAMIERGLTGGSNTDALRDALQAMLDDNIDSDGNGTLDFDEIAQGDDPNPGAAEFCDVLTPNFGCLSHTPQVPALGLVLAALALIRRRSRAEC